MTVNVAGGANTGAHSVTLKSAYTDDSVYFLAAWNDPTESLRREPWVKQANNTWKQLKDPDDKGGDNNKYYEDKFAQIWNINSPGFDTTGCFSTCHAGEAEKHMVINILQTRVKWRISGMQNLYEQIRQVI